jgi:hypothetical protein
MKFKQYIKEEYFNIGKGGSNNNIEFYKNPDTSEMRKLGQMRLLVDNKKKEFYVFSSDQDVHYYALLALVKIDNKLKDTWFSIGWFNNRVEWPKKMTQLVIDACVKYEENKNTHWVLKEPEKLSKFQWLIDKVKLLYPDVPMRVIVGNAHEQSVLLNNTG